jgi:hypothetical protein
VKAALVPATPRQGDYRAGHGPDLFRPWHTIATGDRAMKTTHLLFTLAALVLSGCDGSAPSTQDAGQRQAERAVVTARRVTENATTDAVHAARLAIGDAATQAVPGPATPPATPAEGPGTSADEADSASRFTQRAESAIANARRLSESPTRSDGATR